MTKLSLIILALFSLFHCFIGNVETTDKVGTEVNWCKIPGLPLRIFEAFHHNNLEHKSSTLAGIEYVPAVAQGEWYRLDTTVFVGCIDGYTAISAGSLRISCVTNPSGQATWNETLPTCKRNVCWWFGSLNSDIEFLYLDQKLADQAAGFPEGTTIHYICPDGKETTNTTMKCLSNGAWSGEVPNCVPKESHFRSWAWHQNMSTDNQLTNYQQEMLNSMNRISQASWIMFGMTITIILIAIVIIVICLRSERKTLMKKILSSRRRLSAHAEEQERLENVDENI